MKNFENRVVYLTEVGAGRTFADYSIEGLPVVPTEPFLVGETIVYGAVYDNESGIFISGVSSQDSFTDTLPSEERLKTSEGNFVHHMKNVMHINFVTCRKLSGDQLDEIKATPQVEKIPTLEEYCEMKKETR